MATLSFAQSQKEQIDLAPAQPVVAPAKSNAQLLQDAQKEKVQQAPDSLQIQNMKVDVPVKVTPYSSSQLDNNGQPLNVQSSEINIGNKKATNVIQYDQSGKIRGSGTTIELGK